MAMSNDNGRSPAGGDAEVLASAATLVGLARAPGRPRLAQGVRLACAPFLFRSRPTSANASGSADGTPLLWALLPLASLLPWLSLLAAEAPPGTTGTADAPVAAATPAMAATSLLGDDGGSGRRPRAPDNDPVAFAPLPLRAGPAQRQGAPTPTVLPLRSPTKATPRESTLDASARESVWRAPEVAPAAESDDSRSGPALAEPATRPSAPGPGVEEHTWNPPLVAKRRPAAPPIAVPVDAPPPTLSPPRPARGLDLELPAESAQSEPLPTMRPRAPAPDFSQVVSQVVRQIRSEVTQTVVAEVQKAAVKLAQANPPPRPAEVLAELYTDQSIRKLLARMRRVEQEERRRGGML